MKNVARWLLPPLLVVPAVVAAVSLPAGASADAEPVEISYGDEMTQSGQRSVDISKLETALAQSPGDAILIRDLGLAYVAAGQAGKARPLLRRLMELMEVCADRCPERESIRQAFFRLEAKLLIP